MSRYIARRTGLSLVMLLVSSLLIFGAMRVIPGDPTTAVHSLNETLTPERQEAIRKELGLDQPLAQQYVTWLTNAVQGQFGYSYFSGYPTSELIAQRVGATLELTFAALLLGLLIAVPAALAAAQRPGSAIDRAVVVFSSIGIAIPAFWLGTMLASGIGVQLGWLPARGYAGLGEDAAENGRYLILPALTLSILVAGPVIRFLRASIIEVLSSDYIRTAEGKGLSRRKVVLRHAFPNGLLPTLAVVGVIVGNLLGGVVYIEYVFGWPGLGALTVDSVLKRDYVVLQALVLLAVAAFIITTLAVDLATLALDPRLRREATGQ
jgi:peptide/nickel transport system permease protein